MAKIIKINSNQIGDPSKDIVSMSDAEKLFLDLVAKMIVNKIAQNEKSHCVREDK